MCHRPGSPIPATGEVTHRDHRSRLQGRSQTGITDPGYRWGTWRQGHEVNSPPRLLIVDKTGGVPTSRERTRAIAEVGEFEVHLLCPALWHEHGMRFEVSDGNDGPVTIHTAPVCFSGYYARAFYRRGLGRVLRTVQPDIIQLLEEPYSLFALQTMLLAGRACPKAKIVFYTWENMDRGFTYPARVQFLYRYAERFARRRTLGGSSSRRDSRRIRSSRPMGSSRVICLGKTRRSDKDVEILRWVMWEDSFR